MKTIVVAVDFSGITSNLINKTAEMAACLKARVYIIHVAAPDPEFVGYKVGPIHERKSRVSELKKEKKELEQLARTLRDQGVNATPLLIQGATAELILLETQRLEAGILVMGMHRHGIAVTALLGSTSHQVIKHVSCPVLLIPYEKIGDKNG
jgi:nucleotide-binding universal stress UspA family protein